MRETEKLGKRIVRLNFLKDFSNPIAKIMVGFMFYGVLAFIFT